MKLDQLAVPLIPRTTVNCLDLGMMFYGRCLGPVLALWVRFAMPVAVFVYFAAFYWEWNLLYVLVLLHFVTAPYGVFLGARAIHKAFGEPFDAYPDNRRERGQAAKLILQTLLARLGSGLGLLLFVLPGWWIGVRSSFLVEKACFSELERNGQDRRTSKLVGEELGQLIQRSLGMTLFLSLMAVIMFYLVDFLSSTLFSFPILLGRLSGSLLDTDLMFEMFFEFLFYDPFVLAVFSCVVLLLYPMIRFAWLFSYIDLRVRGDFWDLELRFQKEVERLREGTA